jgi:hypothetical protein
MYGPAEDYAAIYGVHGPLGFELEPQLESKVRLGTALVGSAVGAAVLALVLGGRSRLLAAAGGAAGAFGGGLLTSLVAEKVVTYKRKVIDEGKGSNIIPASMTPPVVVPDGSGTMVAGLDWGGYPQRNGFRRRWGGGPWGVRNGARVY